jgi:hypothetical protein
VNFTCPQNIQDYSLAARKINFDNGSVLTLCFNEGAKVHENVEHKYLENLTKKMVRKHTRSLFVNLPIDWIEINRLKSRVDDILCTLSNKKIKEYISNEIKKQILTNKKLKEYFNDHQEEKEILRSSIESDYKFRFMNKNLDFVPDYCMPKHVLVSAIEKKISGEADLQQTSENVQGLTNDLVIVQKLINIPKPQAVMKVNLRYEDPKTVDPDQLEWTSGRNQWKVTHKKRVRKGIKKAKDGYIGS